jgi:hypothetical protein
MSLITPKPLPDVTADARLSLSLLHPSQAIPILLDDVRFCSSTGTIVFKTTWVAIIVFTDSNVIFAFFPPRLMI